MLLLLFCWLWLFENPVHIWEWDSLYPHTYTHTNMKKIANCNFNSYHRTRSILFVYIRIRYREYIYVSDKLWDIEIMELVKVFGWNAKFNIHLYIEPCGRSIKDKDRMNKGRKIAWAITSCKKTHSKRHLNHFEMKKYRHARSALVDTIIIFSLMPLL